MPHITLAGGRAGGEREEVRVLCRIFPGNREGRENRPQLRCGNASQTSIPREREHSQSGKPDEGGGEAPRPCVAHTCGVRTSAPGKLTRAAANFARDGSRKLHRKNEA